jgi:Cytoplasmic Fragile-X interacting family
MNKEDLTKEDMSTLEAFYKESFAFPYLLDLGGTLRASSDLSDLWYREYHLEITQVGHQTAYYYTRKCSCMCHGAPAALLTAVVHVY